MEENGRKWKREENNGREWKRIDESGGKRKKTKESGRGWKRVKEWKNGREWNKLHEGMEQCEREWTRKEDNGMNRMPGAKWKRMKESGIDLKRMEENDNH